MEQKFLQGMPQPQRRPEVALISIVLEKQQDGPKNRSKRLCENIKSCRAEICPDVISEYLDHLEVTIKDVSVVNIINYAETNLTDDPAKQKIGLKEAQRERATTEVTLGGLIPIFSKIGLETLFYLI
ncbi:hypothetical protein NQ315_014081 [Exocentrus adspersus]|uniref:Uncharacterized protein n=1 Tax=Exocentrus adspersus TaxID=1586481 RepID=A0AAV8VVF0_9CUCU|nr:hypothetical protein NQ315_014081 [Exocentrus adspersus]